MLITIIFGAALLFSILSIRILISEIIQIFKALEDIFPLQWIIYIVTVIFWSIFFYLSH